MFLQIDAMGNWACTGFRCCLLFVEKTFASLRLFRDDHSRAMNNVITFQNSTVRFEETCTLNMNTSHARRRRVHLSLALYVVTGHYQACFWGRGTCYQRQATYPPISTSQDNKLTPEQHYTDNFIYSYNDEGSLDYLKSCLPTCMIKTNNFACHCRQSKATVIQQLASYYTW